MTKDFNLDDFLEDIEFENNASDKRVIANSIKLYLHDISTYRILTCQEEIDLFKQVKEGNTAARTKIINSNLRLVISIVKHYCNYGIPFQDLIQEGNIGLITAVDRFDNTLGNRFSTYASWWIKQAISRCFIERKSLVRIPSHIQVKFNAIKKAEYSFKETHNGLEPTLKELSKLTNIPVDKIKEYKEVIMDVTSLDTKVSAHDDNDTTLADCIPDTDATETMEESILADERKNAIDWALSTLSDIESNIIRKRFGFEGQAMTLEDVGKLYNLSKERIRQIEISAMRKLRHPLRAKTLREFL